MAKSMSSLIKLSNVTDRVYRPLLLTFFVYLCTIVAQLFYHPISNASVHFYTAYRAYKRLITRFIRYTRLSGNLGSDLYVHRGRELELIHCLFQSGPKCVSTENEHRQTFKKSVYHFYFRQS